MAKSKIYRDDGSDTLLEKVRNIPIGEITTLRNHLSAVEEIAVACSAVAGQPGPFAECERELVGALKALGGLIGEIVGGQRGKLTLTRTPAGAGQDGIMAMARTEEQVPVLQRAVNGINNHLAHLKFGSSPDKIEASRKDLLGSLKMCMDALTDDGTGGTLEMSRARADAAAPMRREGTYAEAGALLQAAMGVGATDHDTMNLSRSAAENPLLAAMTRDHK